VSYGATKIPQYSTKIVGFIGVFVFSGLLIFSKIRVEV